MTSKCNAFDFGRFWQKNCDFWSRF